MPPSPKGRLITSVICGGGIIPDRLRWFHQINAGADIIRTFFIGWDYNPSVISFRNATSLCTREAVASAVCGGTPHPALRATFPSRGRLALRDTCESLFRLFCNKLQKIHLPLKGKAALRESFFRADIIRPYGFLIILHFALCIVH